MPDLDSPSSRRSPAAHRARRATDASRDPRSVTLLAVSKTFPAEDVRATHAAGQHAFGENYVQEAVAKITELADLRASLEWHFIGPLQSNKTRPVAENFDWVHSVDRLKIAQRLAEQRPAHLPPLNVCLQVNVSGEASKAGVSPAEAAEVAHAIAALPQLRLRGLMSIPEPAETLDEQRAPHRQSARTLGAACARTGLNWTRCRWACRAISKRRCSKARQSCASVRRSSAPATTLTEPSRNIMKIAFIGGGNMAAAIIGGLIKHGVAPTGSLRRSTPAKKRASATSSSSAFARVRRSTRNLRAVRRNRAGREAADSQGRG